MSYTLGVDIGTFETKGVLVDEAGQIIAQAAHGHEMIVPQAGWAEHRAEEDWWGDFVRVTRQLLQASRIDAGEIACVACSAIGPCMLPVDATGAPLMNGVLYGVDTRAQAEIDTLNARIGADVILERCGNALTSQSVGPKILWLRNQRLELFERMSHVMTSTSFLVMRLTGEIVIDHYTAANFSPLYDVEKRAWVNDLAPDIIDLEHLPRLMWSGEIAGEITQAAARETGLAIGTPVTCGTIDAAAEAVSVGVRVPGDMMMMYGSTIFMIGLAKERSKDPRLWYAPWLSEGEHATMAGLATSGTLTHWFRDQFAKELPRDGAFEILAREAQASPPGAKGLIALPYFSGERTPIHDPGAKGTFFGLNLTHDRGDLYRALIEGIAFGTGHVFEAYGDVGQTPNRLLAVGGGVKNELWLQATSDVSGIDQIISSKTIGASYGNAFLAACAIGKAERDDIADWNPAKRKVDAQSHDSYVRNFELFKQLYIRTRDIMAELAP